jgi:ubiquinone/menaquinone biosynthesis C-methylase UbiE
MYHTGNQLIDPKLLYEKVQLRKGMHIADLGCGRTGQFVFSASPIVGPHGMIYAVDIMKDILEGIKKQAELEKFSNIYTVWSNVEILGKTAIPEKSLDAVFFINSLSHFDNLEGALNEANRLLKSKSRMLVVDWMDNSLSIAPKGDNLVDFTKIVDWAKENNYSVQEQFQAGKYHKGFVLYKNE